MCVFPFFATHKKKLWSELEICRKMSKWVGRRITQAIFWKSVTLASIINFSCLWKWDDLCLAGMMAAAYTKLESVNYDGKHLSVENSHKTTEGKKKWDELGKNCRVNSKMDCKWMEKVFRHHHIQAAERVRQLGGRERRKRPAGEPTQFPSLSFFCFEASSAHSLCAFALNATINPASLNAGRW